MVVGLRSRTMSSGGGGMAEYARYIYREAVPLKRQDEVDLLYLYSLFLLYLHLRRSSVEVM